MSSPAAHTLSLLHVPSAIPTPLPPCPFPLNPSLPPVPPPPIPIPPPPLTSLSIPHCSSSASPQPKPSFASLFQSKTRTAGSYVPIHFDVPYVGKSMEPPTVVVDGGVEQWSESLVGSFLAGNVNYMAVKMHLERNWKLKGEYEVFYDKQNYYFRFACEEDKNMILRRDPMFIRGQMFIISSLTSAQASIKAVPIWVHFYKIPIMLWSLIGINWLACHLGKLVCFDENTEKMKRFEYAKCLIEISPDKELPEFLVVGDDSCPNVLVEYTWKPLICTTRKIFGHDNGHCDRAAEAQIASCDKKLDGNKENKVEKNQERMNKMTKKNGIS